MKLLRIIIFIVCLFAVGIFLVFGLITGAIRDFPTAWNYLIFNCYSSNAGGIIDCNSYETSCPNLAVDRQADWKNYTNTDFGLFFKVPVGYNITETANRIIISNMNEGNAITFRDRITIDRLNLSFEETLLNEEFGFGEWQRTYRGATQQGPTEINQLHRQVFTSHFLDKSLRSIRLITFCSVEKDCLRTEPDLSRPIYKITIEEMRTISPWCDGGAQTPDLVDDGIEIIPLAEEKLR